MKYLSPLSPVASMIFVVLYSSPTLAEGSHTEAAAVTEQMTVVEKKEKRQQDVQAATSVLSRGDLQDAGVAMLEDLNTRTPNMHIQKAGGASENFISIRGIVGQRQVATPAGIGVYIDGVNYLDPLSTLTYTDLEDVERIEILRGPQGTLYGRNAEAGVINILTRKPDGSRRLYGEITSGNKNLQKYQLGGETGLIEDTLAVSGSAMWMQRDGMTRNTYVNRDLTDLEQYFLRGRVRWTPSESTEVLLNLDGHNSTDGPQDMAFIPDGDRSQATAHENSYNFFGEQTHKAKGASVQWNQQLDGLRFTSITAVRDAHERTLGESDFTQYDLYVGDFFSDQRQYTQELRLASDNDSPWQWMVGTYWFRLNNDFGLINYIGEDAVDEVSIPATMDIDSRGRFVNSGTSVFGETSWTFDNGISVTGGLRWETETAKSDENASMHMLGMTLLYGEFHGEKTFTNLLPKLAVGWQASPDLNFYTSVAKGARSGGFNSVAQVPEGNSYDPEISINYEIGVKSLWLDKRVMLNAAIFQTDIKDLQIGRRISDGTVITTNAGKARNRGAEVELLTKPFESDLQIGASLGYVEAKYTDYDDPLAGANYNGKRVPLVPQYTAGVSAQYRMPLTSTLDGFIRGEWQHVDKTYWNDSNQYYEPAYDLANLRLGVEASDWQLYFWAKNLFDANYVRNGAGSSIAPGMIASWGEQRTYGATLRFEF
ncbi:TonB-dependent receptor [Pantoea coffeiphila]|uniref:TonB-dependent receptor n=1 Tax=Pantoea coffeiphila TaxID=1465635 RepID=UPI001960C079|nr:TonB-dependent receptor [Pantoea coffeiphila]MBM7342787.1 iron complex outermembrane receptor protein [Pantoea coffeiphila]